MKKIRLKNILCMLVCWLCVYDAQAQILEVKTGHVYFHSVATKELVNAASNSLSGLIDVNKKVFAFKIPVASFFGFNNPLQQEHFNENYMETDLFPEAIFVGKIIENVDVSVDGEYVIRAKGKLKIHGVEQERIIKSTVTIKGNNISAHTDFPVLLADYNIKIPRIVYEKIATEVSVTVNAVFEKRERK
jgi:polyisoprenoid-binding protein YceI